MPKTIADLHDEARVLQKRLDDPNLFAHDRVAFDQALQAAMKTVLYVSHDRGAKWRFVGSLPVSQFYHVSYDMEWPYNVYGGLQDNGGFTRTIRLVNSGNNPALNHDKP